MELKKTALASDAQKVQAFRDRRSAAGQIRIEAYVSAEDADAVDAWRKQHNVKSRSEAVALLLSFALTASAAAERAVSASSGISPQSSPEEASR